MQSNNTNDPVIEIKQSVLQGIEEKSELRRQAMCEVLNLVRFIFGDDGIPKSKAALLRRVTSALMRGDELEQYLSKIDRNAVEKYIELTKK